jgi:SAM-dependent methyltransferase
MNETLLRHIHQINERHPWSHNDHYHPWLMGRLPRHLEQALDVGCGTGNLLQALATKADVVVGVDPDPAMVATARRRTEHLSHVRVLDGSLRALPDATYDAVTAVAVVHHTDLEQALAALHRVTAPEGRILVVGCYRTTTTLDHLTDAVAIPANVLMGILRSRGAGPARLALSAPTATPSTSLREVRAVAARILPGARIRRRLFWRYTLDYRNS